jgi:hypothetical protein
MPSRKYHKNNTRFFDCQNKDIWTGLFPWIVKYGSRVMMSNIKYRVVAVIHKTEIRLVRVTRLDA